MLDKFYRIEERIIDVVNTVAGAALALAPWLLGFASEPLAAWNAWLVGAAITLIGVGALVAKLPWDEWAMLVLGAWAAISPWVLGFSSQAAATGAHLVLGLVVLALALLELWFTHNRPLSAA